MPITVNNTTIVLEFAPTAYGEGNRLSTEFRGALTENFVLQTLLTQFEVMPRLCEHALIGLALEKQNYSALCFLFLII